MTVDQPRASPATAEPYQIADDLLEGAEAISEFMYGDRSKKRKVYHLAQTSDIPVFRFGATLCARRSKIIAWIERQETEASERALAVAESRRASRVSAILAAEKVGGSA